MNHTIYTDTEKNAIRFSEFKKLEKQIGPSVLGFIGYVPKLSTNWGLSSQIIFSVDPSEVSQIVRFGLDYKYIIQFGLGLDMFQRFNTSTLNTNTGIFLRFNL